MRASKEFKAKINTHDFSILFNSLNLSGTDMEESNEDDELVDRNLAN